MNEFCDPPAIEPPSSDPLERLIEAFVGQSAPDGPDQATQRRLLAAMAALDADPAPGSPALQPPVLPDSSSRELWLGVSAHQVAALAAILLVVATMAFILLLQPAKAPAPTGPSIDELMARRNSEVPQVEAETPGPQDFDRLVAEFQRNHGGRLPEHHVFVSMLRQVLHDHDLAESKSWRLAQDALERPQVIGMGVGLLGTVPWTTLGRF
jgi:hypothetical protein